MDWPKATDYGEAIQQLQFSVGEEELRAGQLALTPLGLPMLWSGNYADVYRIDCPATGNTWALKCFTRKVPGLSERYQAISAHLRRARLPFMVDFQYLEQGIRVRGTWFPALKMRWVKGVLFNEFVEEYLDRPRTLQLLLKMWAKLAVRLREARIAHADLQHGNVILIPQQDGQFALRLIDYDGMFVPKLSGTQSGEVGHPAFQHPQRLREGVYNADVDRFSHLAIYCAVSCLRSGKKDLWNRFNNGDNLLFRESDFAAPSESELFSELWRQEDKDTRTLAGHLFLACQRPLERTPLLEEIVRDGHIAPLSSADEAAVNRVLQNGKSSGPRKTPATGSAEEKPWWVSSPTPIQDGQALNTAPADVRDGVRRKDPLKSGHVQCPSCANQVLLPSAVIIDEVVAEPESLVSPAVTVTKTAGIWTEMDIEVRGFPWQEEQPEPCVSRLAAVTAVILLGLVAVITLLLSQFAGGASVMLPVIVLTIATFLSAGAVGYFYKPRLLSPLDATWELVVPSLVGADPNPILSGFLIGLARASVGKGDSRRRRAIMEEITAKHGTWVRDGTLPYPYLGQLYRLAISDELRKIGGGQAVVESLAHLMQECIQGRLPINCIDEAFTDGSAFGLLNSKTLTILPHHVTKICFNIGCTIADIERVSHICQTIRLAFSTVSAKQIAFLYAVLAVFQSGQIRFDLVSVFGLINQGKTSEIERHPDILAISTDGTVAVFASGVHFHGATFTSRPQVSWEEVKTFVQTGWTYQRKDGGPDRRYKSNPPVGYWRVISYRLTVGGRTFTYSHRPDDIADTIRGASWLLFDQLLPQVDRIIQQPPSEKLPELWDGNQKSKCAECGTVIDHSSRL